MACLLIYATLAIGQAGHEANDVTPTATIALQEAAARQGGILSLVASDRHSTERRTKT